jgi:NADP-dependent 3-hydroxy acid dehydrogenase YdfG
MFTSAPEPEAPITVIVRLKNGMSSSFGCARRVIENGFHVFFYPSEVDRYRETRREFAISEIIELEITEARQVYNFVTPAQTVLKEAAPIVNNASGPVIHSARQNAAGIIGALENSSGPIKMDKMPNLSFGDSEA